MPSKHLLHQLLRLLPTACREYSSYPYTSSSYPNDVSRKPKSAAKDKPKTNGTAITNGANKGKSTRAKKPGRNNRPKKKTAEELDAEMQDYFGGDSGAATTTAQPAAAVAGGDTGMVDEVL